MACPSTTAACVSQKSDAESPSNNDIHVYARASHILHRLTYEARAALATCDMSRRCLELMARKKTNLAVAADVDTTDEVLKLADLVGPSICVFKTHVDILDRWTEQDALALQQLAEKHGEGL
jgi:hypothetical protein